MGDRSRFSRCEPYCGVICNKPSMPHTECLRRLYGGISELIDLYTNIGNLTTTCCTYSRILQLFLDCSSFRKIQLTAQGIIYSLLILEYTLVYHIKNICREDNIFFRKYKKNGAALYGHPVTLHCVGIITVSPCIQLFCRHSLQPRCTSRVAGLRYPVKHIRSRALQLPKRQPRHPYYTL